MEHPSESQNFLMGDTKIAPVGTTDLLKLSSTWSDRRSRCKKLFFSHLECCQRSKAILVGEVSQTGALPTTITREPNCSTRRIVSCSSAISMIGGSSEP